MKDYKQTLLDLILKITDQKNGQRHVVYLEGGYYDTRLGPGEFSTNTLTGCIEVAEKIVRRPYKITRVVLGVLANDIGMACGEDACILPTKKSFSEATHDTVLPTSLENLLKQSKVSQNDQTIFTNEKKLRNRGLRIVKEMANNPEKYSLLMEEKADDEVVCNVVIDGNKIPLAIKKGDTWSARCPLIMGQHYSDLYIKFAKKYGDSTNQLLVDMSEMYDRHKVNNGAKVALLLLREMYGYDVSKARIANLCFQDDELTQYELDLTEGSV